MRDLHSFHMKMNAKIALVNPRAFRDFWLLPGNLAIFLVRSEKIVSIWKIKL